MHDARNDPHVCERIGDSSVARTAWDRERDQAPHALLAARQPRACFFLFWRRRRTTRKIGA